MGKAHRPSRSFRWPGRDSRDCRAGEAREVLDASGRQLPAEPLSSARDGKEVLFIGGYQGYRGGTNQLASHGLACNPATNYWRWLPNMPYPCDGFAAVWAGQGARQPC